MASSGIHSRYTAMAALLACTSALSACGGAGSEVASVSLPLPAPNQNYQSVGWSFSVLKPLARAPAWTTGTYQGIALVDNELGDNQRVPAGAVSLTVDTSAKTYTLTVSTGSLADAPTSFNIPRLGNPTSCGTCWTDSYIGSTVKSVTHWSDGVTRPETDGTGDATIGQYRSQTKLPGERELDSTLSVSSVPGRHVSLGAWASDEYSLNTDGTRKESVRVSRGVFAFGDRTAPGDIPVSGTARYTVETPEEYRSGPINLIRSTVFDVDFAAQSIAADVSRSLEVDLYPYGVTCCYGWEESSPDPATRIGTVALTTEASGMAPITSAGNFDIALAGTALVQTNRTDKTPVADISSPVSGSVSGAFFGPQAGELGGTYILPDLPSPDGTVNSVSGAFTAVQSKP